MPEADLATARRLAERFRGEATLDGEDLQAAEDLYLRHPEAGPLLEAILLREAQQEHKARNHAAAAALLRRATLVSPASVPARRFLLTVLLDQSDWVSAEAAARALLALRPADPEGIRGLAYALVRRDQTREAVDLLSSFLQSNDDREARELLERIRHDAAVETTLGRQDIAHFHVRYDGAAHEDVGREVLRVLEAHYAALVRTFDQQPAEPIPVILLSRQSYYHATGAPFWAGGHFDTFDGRIRIPIGGLTTSLTPDLDETVLHELTHAFVAERSGGFAPRELQEGLAQLVSGKRASSLTEDELRGLASGRIGGVAGFYLRALVFAEELMAERGQGGINDLLAAMARSRDVDAAFREVYGKDFQSLQLGVSTRLRQRYGG